MSKQFKSSSLPRTWEGSVKEDHDGMMKGYDYSMFDDIRKITTLPLTILGGAGSLEDIGKLINKHHIITSYHPSPLSARRKFKEFPAFLGSKPFSKINNLLTEKIHW